jgi:hypothetical protein
VENETDVKQGTFEGWAVVEMMGHRKEIGYVTTQAFGQAVLFRVDTPELPEREYVLESPEYASDKSDGTQWCPVGTKVKRGATSARSCLVAPSSLYAINPCSEQAAMALIERNVHRPLIVLELPEQAALQAAPDYDYDGTDEQGIEDDF